MFICNVSSMFLGFNVSTMSGKRKRVVLSSDVDFPDIRVCGYLRFPASTLPRKM